MIDVVLFPILSDNKATLKDTSKDVSDPNNIQYMTSSELEVINFDIVKRVYANLLGLSEDVVTSVDAVMLTKDTVLFIEFKNGRIDNRKLKDKARDSLLIFLEIIKKDLSFSRKSVEYIVVYNRDKNPLPNQCGKQNLQDTPSRIEIANAVGSLANQEIVRFDLQRYEGMYYRKIHTYTSEQFEQYLGKYLVSN